MKPFQYRSFYSNFAWPNLRFFDLLFTSQPILTVLLLIAIAAPASADLLPMSEHDSQRRRADANSYDQADQYCKGRKVGDSCLLLGNPFEGGGEGVCTGELGTEGDGMRLHCNLTVSPEIDRQLPASPFTADSIICDESLPPEGHCAPPPYVTDRFCSGQELGEACEVELSLGDKTEQYPGLCLYRKQIVLAHRREGWSTERQVLMCMPANTPPAREWHKVSLWRQLWPR